MKKFYKIVAETPYAGTTAEEYIMADNTDDVEDYAADLCEENAAGYEYLINGWDGDDPTEEEIEDYYESCGWWYEEISFEEYLENIAE